jgi:mercuric ion transport protein
MSQLGKTWSLFSRRRLGLAGLAAILGCAVCCALPFLAAAGLGGGAAAGLGRILRPGSELIVGGVVFAVTLGVMALRRRLKRPAACGPSCRADGGCCDHKHATT